MTGDLNTSIKCSNACEEMISNTDPNADPNADLKTARNQAQTDQHGFDPSEAANRPGLAAYLNRAADWRARLAPSTVPVALPPSTAGVPLIVLPPELNGIGQTAAILAAAAGRPLRTVTAQPVLGQPTTAVLTWLSRKEQAPHRASLLAVDGADHPVTVLQTILHAAGLTQLLPDAESAPPAACAYLTSCRPTSPAPANPAKQLALRLHQRLPIFVGDGMDSAIAHDWSVRLHWRAEHIAWDLNGPDLVRTSILAHLPRYWPNSACYVSLAGAPPSAGTQITQAALDLLRRRRFPIHSVSLPDGLGEAQRAWLLLELGEWVALYVAWLNNADPSARVPHTILFGA
jgi:hypothetical protein